ncbi:MAG TPA: DUF4350 domain-containing protein [Minicystis sp.]|nr:DUF4350 domain-containing protein [Minicystis sp.]
MTHPVSRPRPAPPRRLVRAVTALLLAALVVLLSGAALADAFEVNDTGWEGCSELLEIARAELGAARVQAVAVLNWEDVQPEDGVLALHPLKPMDPDETAAFMKAGGRLAILDDYGMGAETLRRFQIERIATPNRPVSALRNRPALAIAEPVVDVVAGRTSGPHPIVAHVQQLVTNHATGLRRPPPELTNVLKIRAIGEPDVVIAMAGMVGKGRLFAMGDPSAVINEMLRYPGNRAFVAGLAHYLVDDDGATHRQGRLFILANRFAEEGSFGGRTTARKEIESSLRAIAAALAQARESGLPWWAHFVLAALVGVGVTGWAVRSSARPYKSPMPRYARPVPLVAQGGVAGRLAMLVAPTSPRSLSVLELKSALFEGVAARLALDAEPSAERLVELLRGRLRLDDVTLKKLQDALAYMQKVEAAVVAGRGIRVPRAELARANAAVHEVLDACEGAGLPWAGAPARGAERLRPTEGDIAG